MTSVTSLFAEAYLAESVAGITYMVMAYLLIRLGSRTGGAPEWLLGAHCLLVGISYALSDIPRAMHLDELIIPLNVASRLCYALSVIFVSHFARRTFYDEDTLGRWLQCISILLMVIGIGVSAVQGDWVGYNPLHSVGYWFEWVGQILPFVWLGLAGLVEADKSHRRVRLGLSHPLVRHRFTFISVFGFTQVCNFFMVSALYIISESSDQWTVGMDLAFAGGDILNVAIIAIAYFPPRFLTHYSWLNPASARAADS